MIDEDTIMAHLDLALSKSQPGASLHHLAVLRAPADALGPLGTVPPDAIESIVFAIAADVSGSDETPEQFIATVVAAAAADALKAGTVVWLATLGQEMWTVSELDEQARHLLAQGRLQEHPQAVEATLVYAACRDGRRWRGRRYLTGPLAGQSADVDLLVGAPRRGEGHGIPAEGLLRRLVGIGGPPGARD